MQKLFSLIHRILRSDMKSKCGNLKMSNCLFCLRRIKSHPNNGGGGIGTEIVGAVRIKSLEARLANFFILQKLLDVPTSWTAETLENSGMDLSEWFQICSICRGLVNQAWELHQVLLMAQDKIQTIRGKLRRKIVCSSKKKTKSFVTEQLTQKIRKLTLPKVKKKTGGGVVGVEENNDDGDINGDLQDDEVGGDSFVRVKAEGGVDLDRESSGIALKSDRKRRRDRLAKSGNQIKRTRNDNNRAHARVYTWRCELCPEKYKEEVDLQKHQRLHEESSLKNGEFDCPVCKYPCLEAKELALHTERKHRPQQVYNCKLCSFIANMYCQLEKHAQEEHPDASTEECGLETLECPQCHQVLATRSAYITHKRRQHPEMFGAEATELICDECGEKFNSSILLHYHKKRHVRLGSKNKYFCETCGKGYEFLSRLNQHMQGHGSIRQFVCEICGIDYPFKHSMAKHYRNHHPGVQPSCSASAAATDVPIKIEAEVVPNSAKRGDYICRVCGMKMPYVFRNRHWKTHTQSLGHQCGICQKHYSNPNALKRHKEINHSGKQAECPYCSKLFVHPAYVKMHFKHCKMKPENSNSPQPPIPVRKESEPIVSKREEEKVIVEPYHHHQLEIATTTDVTTIAVSEVKFVYEYPT